MKNYQKPELYEEALQQAENVALGEEGEVSAGEWLSKVTL